MRTQPIPTYGRKSMFEAVWVPRHRRRSALHRGRYLIARWPQRAPQDLLEAGGRVAVLWTTFGLLGTTALASSIVQGATSKTAAVLNATTIAALAAVHCGNAYRCRRRRSVLVGPAALVATVLAIVRMRSGDYRIDDWWTVVGVAWIPAACADLAFPRWTYLARSNRSATSGDKVSTV